MALPGVPATTGSPDVEWEAEEAWLRCVVRWPDDRPRLARVLPLFEHLGLVLVDHQPLTAADSFTFAQVQDPNPEELLPLLAEPSLLPRSVRWTETGSPHSSSRRTCARGRCGWPGRPVSTYGRLGWAPAPRT